MRISDEIAINTTPNSLLTYKSYKKYKYSNNIQINQIMFKFIFRRYT